MRISIKPLALFTAVVALFASTGCNTVSTSYKQDIGFAKIDWRLSDRNSLTFDMNVVHWRSPNGIQTQAVLTGGAALGNNGGQLPAPSVASSKCHNSFA